MTNDHQAEPNDSRIGCLPCGISSVCACGGPSSRRAPSSPPRAPQLHPRPPSVSTSRRPQKAVGAPLYRRSGRGIEVTELGRRLAEESADVFTGLGRLDSLVESYRTVSRPRMRIAAFTSFNAVLLPDIIAPRRARA